MPSYRVWWKKSAQSIVEAASEDEAREKANLGEDEGFDECVDGWQIDEIEAIE